MITNLKRQSEHSRKVSLLRSGALPKSIALLVVMIGAITQAPTATELQNSEVDLALHRLRYSALDRIAALRDSDEPLTDVEESLGGDFGQGEIPGKKNVLKAGILSLVVPGLGQVYNGSHVGKVALFVGAEVGLLLGAKKFNNDANDIVADFQTFARANWNEQDYWDYLNQVYGDTTDAEDDLGASHGHHLPSTETQQYFEMIGKYDQFSYGWARAEGYSTDSIITWDPATDRYANNNRFPSPKRIAYNNRRADANNTFNKRDRMIIFAIVNHVVSSIDAAVSAKRHNKGVEEAAGGLSFHPSLRHDENWAFIPELKLSWRF